MGLVPQEIKMEKQNRLHNYDEKFDWSNYNRSQTNEKIIFIRLLNELCELLETDLDKEEGKNCHNIAHKIFCMCMKVYLNTSARKLISDLKICEESGYLNTVSHFNSVLNYFRDRNTKKTLKYLIELSAKPLAQLEKHFAIDSSGVSLNQYSPRWSSIRQTYSRHKDYKKMHVLFGTLTNVAVNVIVTRGDRADSPYFDKLLKRAVENFNVKEISGDRAYLSRNNIQLCEELNIFPLVPFKSNTSKKARGCVSWKKAYDYFKNNSEEFFRRYHLRSNAESGFMMIKTRFGNFVRSKDDVAQENEILTKILCHNITILVQEIFLHNIEINFLKSAKMLIAQAED